MINKKRTRAFLLIEYLLALGLTAFLLGTINIAFKTSLRMNATTEKSEQIEWEQFVNVISAENLALQFMKTQDKIVFFSSLTKQKEYRLVYYNDLVKMTGADGGYLPLLYDVSQFDAVFHDNLLVIDATMQKRKYHCEIVMGKKE